MIDLYPLPHLGSIEQPFRPSFRPFSCYATFPIPLISGSEPPIAAPLSCLRLSGQLSSRWSVSLMPSSPPIKRKGVPCLPSLITRIRPDLFHPKQTIPIPRNNRRSPKSIRVVLCSLSDFWRKLFVMSIVVPLLLMCLRVPRSVRGAWMFFFFVLGQKWRLFIPRPLHGYVTPLCRKISRYSPSPLNTPFSLVFLETVDLLRFFFVLSICHPLT